MGGQTASGPTATGRAHFGLLVIPLPESMRWYSPVFVSMITGSVVIDVYFSTGGIGKAFVDSALNRDYAVMMGVTILVGALTILFNLVVDILYAWIDPKIRY